MQVKEASTTKELNARMKEQDSMVLTGILGQRYLGNAFIKGAYELHGYAGNGFASFLNGASMTLYGNAQEAVADTMSSGSVVIHGSCGDALAYGMRGGRVFVKQNCGARCGVHMKEYGEETLLIIGGVAKDFLGEYLSGGTILVLNQALDAHPVGRYCGVGAHGGAIYVRMQRPLPGWQPVEEDTRIRIDQLISEYCQVMQLDSRQFQEAAFYQLPLSKSNPYEGLYITY